MLSELALALYFQRQDFITNFPRTTTVLFDGVSAVNAMRLQMFSGAVVPIFNVQCYGCQIHV